MVCNSSSGLSNASPMSTAAAPCSAENAYEVASICDWSQLRLQTLADLLLLKMDLRPVTSDALALFHDSFSQCRDTIVAKTKELSVLINIISTQLHSITARWSDICNCIGDMSQLVIGLIECCSHAAYLVSNCRPDCQPPTHGIIDKYKLCRSSVDVELSCARLKQSFIEELTPQVLVTLCSDITENLSVLTECCRVGSESAADASDQEQFKLCVKCMTSNATCLLASIRSFKVKPTETSLRRCIGFGEALVASTNALVNFASEPEFVGEPAAVSPSGKAVQSSILGACMSIVSSCVQLCKTVRSLAFDNKNPRHRGRANLCLESLTKSTNHLAETLTLQQLEEMRLNHKQDSESDTSTSTSS